MGAEDDQGGGLGAPSVAPSVAADALAEACPDFLLVLDLEGRVLYLNPNARETLGARGQPGADVCDLWPEETRFSLRRALEAAASGQVRRFRTFFHGEGQSRTYFETVISPVRAPDGAAERLLVMARDVTSEVETSAFLRSVIQLLPSPLVVRNVDDRRFALVNQAAEALMGLRKNDAFGWDGEAEAPAHVAERLRTAEDEVLAAGEMRTYDLTLGEESPETARHFTVKLLATHDDAGPRHLITLADDVTERHRAAEALREALKAAETASEAKSAFLANMSHELRTPLNGVIAGADLLARSDLPAPARDLVAMIRNSSAALERLLSDVLDLARAEQGQIALQDQAFHVGDAVRATAALFRTEAEQKGLSLDVEISPELDALARGDHARLHQVLSCLLGNAVKFTQAGGVALRAVRGAGSARAAFFVEDTGVGFDAAEKARLFARFHQADNSSTRRFGGAGLGLAIARELVELMGGTIDCEPRKTGGSRFWIEIPLPAHGAEAPASDSAARAASGALRVLLADDHPTNRQVVQLMLSGAADIVCAENGAEAVEAFTRGRFDLVLMDIQMPVMDGHAAVRELRRMEAERGAERTPVIMLTANNRPEHVQASLEAGADRHLGKPVTTRALFGAIEEALAEIEPSEPGLYQAFGHVGA